MLVKSKPDMAFSSASDKLGVPASYGLRKWVVKVLNYARPDVENWQLIGVHRAPDKASEQSFRDTDCYGINTTTSSSQNNGNWAGGKYTAMKTNHADEGDMLEVILDAAGRKFTVNNNHPDRTWSQTVELPENKDNKPYKWHLHVHMYYETSLEMFDSGHTRFGYLKHIARQGVAFKKVGSNGFSSMSEMAGISAGVAKHKFRVLKYDLPDENWMCIGKCNRS